MSKYIDEHITSQNKYIFDGNDKFVYGYVLDEIKKQDPEKVIGVAAVLEDRTKAVDIYNALMANDKIEAFNMYLVPVSDQTQRTLVIEALVLDELTQTTFKLLGDKGQAKFEILTRIK